MKVHLAFFLALASEAVAHEIPVCVDESLEGISLIQTSSHHIPHSKAPARAAEMVPQIPFEKQITDSVHAVSAPTKGPYKTAHNHHDYDITGTDNGTLHVYYPEGTDGEQFPLISYLHGASGSMLDLLAYSEHFSQLASYGFVVVAPNTCNFRCKDAVKSPFADCNQVAVTGTNPDADGWNTFFGEQIKAISMSRGLAKSGDAIFKSIDWNAGIAIAGHSMGGQATAWAAHKNCTSQWDIKTAAIHHGMGGTTNEMISVPVIAMAGKYDGVSSAKTKDVFTKSPVYPKVFREVGTWSSGGTHTEPVFTPNPLLATYTAAWFKYTLGLDKDNKYHDMIFGNNDDSLCNSQKMSECILREHAVDA